MTALQPIILQTDQTDQTALQTAVESALGGLSPNTRRAYRAHIDRWRAWSPDGPLDRSSVKAYIRALELQGASPQVRNQALAAIKRLAHESAELGWMEPRIAAQIQSIKSRKPLGVRVGQWLTVQQASALLQAPDGATLQGRRDRTILSLLVGCGLRRSEAAALTVAQVVTTDDRTILTDIVGKGGRVRSVAVPRWAALIVNEWIEEISANDKN